MHSQRNTGICPKPNFVAVFHKFTRGILWILQEKMVGQDPPLTSWKAVLVKIF